MWLSTYFSSSEVEQIYQALSGSVSGFNSVSARLQLPLFYSYFIKIIVLLSIDCRYIFITFKATSSGNIRN